MSVAARRVALAALFGLCFAVVSVAQDVKPTKPADDKKAEDKKAEEKKPTEEKKPAVAPAFTADTIKRLSLRGIGPCFTPGRIGDVAVDPKNRNVWYVALASGGVWKTTNRGTTWKPIFDDQGAYSIGCVTVDAKNPQVVWVGTGENQSQRSVGFGDGVYRSDDGGGTWKHLGLKNSEHIAKVLIDPRYSDVVYVAAQGPLWGPGGDRGLYKTTDNGKTWKAVLTASENTGVTDVCFDPRDPDVLYAATYQRRRHVGVLIGGGPEAGIHKSADGGKTWVRLTDGLPKENLGRIALAVSPQRPDVIYAHVQTAQTQKERGGFFRSEDGGKTWVKKGQVQIQDGQYYGEIYADPHQFDKVWVMDMNVRMTDDGGKTFRGMNWPVHPDHHALVFDPTDPDHLISGNDGGLYESFDGGKTWRHFNTLPTGQYYRVAVDEAKPFYNVYGGLQDNGSHGGPSRSRNRVGVRTSDWWSAGGGDGFQPRIDPTDPDVVYSQSQNAALVRTDRGTGESKSIRPRDRGVRWHWDTPLLLSPHHPRRVYLAGSKLFRSDDRGDTWTAVSPDLTRQLDPLKQEVMGQVWGDDAVSRNTFTTALSCATSFDESPLQEGLLYVGTDDGLFQVSADGGRTWRKEERFPGVPENAYITDVFASARDVDTVFVSFNHYQRGDFKPYLLKSTDRGRTWASVAGDLPARHCVWSVVEDDRDPDLLFAGTEFGLFVTTDGGANWVKVPGAPPVMFRDLQVQRREGDLVCGTFGRGIYILDDYAALRGLTAEARAKDGVLLPVRKTLGFAELSFTRASGEFAAPNPPPGALLTYHLRESVKEKLVLKVTDAAGKAVNELTVSSGAGLHRTNWDLRAASGSGVAAPGGGRPGGAGVGAPPAGGGAGRAGGAGEQPPEGEEPPPRPRFGGGPLVKPGKYTLTLAKMVDGKPIPLGDPQTVEVVPLVEPTAVSKP
jgi:photosystem II stability/assembly factor-like uncharacterized protein